LAENESGAGMHRFAFSTMKNETKILIILMVAWVTIAALTGFIFSRVLHLFNR